MAITSGAPMREPWTASRSFSGFWAPTRDGDQPRTVTASARLTRTAVTSLFLFSLARITGNPLDVMLPLEAGPEEYERVAKHWGLDRPLYVQYWVFLSKAVQGDFGHSWKWHGYTAMGLVWERLPATLELAGFALLISILIALPVGVGSAVYKGTVWDLVAKVIALLGQSLPGFWLGIVL